MLLVVLLAREWPGGARFVRPGEGDVEAPVTACVWLCRTRCAGPVESRVIKIQRLRSLEKLPNSPSLASVSDPEHLFPDPTVQKELMHAVFHFKWGKSLQEEKKRGKLCKYFFG